MSIRLLCALLLAALVLPVEAQRGFGSIFRSGTSIIATAADSAGNIYLAGATRDPDFPVTADAFQKTFVRVNCPDFFGRPVLCEHGFLAKIDATGTRLLYATYLGGSRQDRAGRMAVSASDGVYVTGYTSSRDFPVTPGAFQTGPGSGFLIKLNSDGSAAFSTYLPESPSALALDKDSNIFLAGAAPGVAFPTTTGAFQSQRFLGWGDAFVMKLNSSADRLIYSTLMGGTFDEGVRALLVDSEGNAYVAGYTASSRLNSRLKGGIYLTQVGRQEPLHLVVCGQPSPGRHDHGLVRCWIYSHGLLD